MRLHHLRPGRGSTSGVQEGTLGLLGSTRGSKGQQETRGESQGSLQSQRAGVYSRAFIFLQPLCSQGDRPNSGKLKEIQAGHCQISSEHILPLRGTGSFHQPQHKPQQLKHKPQSQYSPDCIPHSLAEQTTKAQQTTGTDTTVGCNFPQELLVVILV